MYMYIHYFVWRIWKKAFVGGSNVYYSFQIRENDVQCADVAVQNTNPFTYHYNDHHTSGKL